MTTSPCMGGVHRNPTPQSCIVPTLLNPRDFFRFKRRKNMKVKTLALTLALCFAGAAVSLAQSPQMGTWKLNEAKSKVPAGSMKNTTVIYAMDGDNIKVTTEGTGKDDKPLHTEWSGLSSLPVPSV